MDTVITTENEKDSNDLCVVQGVVQRVSLKLNFFQNLFAIRAQTSEVQKCFENEGKMNKKHLCWPWFCHLDSLSPTQYRC